MSKFFMYLKHEGLGATISKILTKFNRRPSITNFVRCNQSAINCANRSDISIKDFEASDFSEFDRIKFFDHIDGHDYLKDGNRKIILAYLNSKLVGYIAAEWGGVTDKHIHGLGYFELKDKEAWIGPVYVVRKYRSKGISSHLIKTIMQRLREANNFDCFYTSINANNPSSLRSFNKCGFELIGSVTTHQGKYDNQLQDSFAKRFKAE